MNTTALFALSADAYEVPSESRSKFGRFLDRHGVAADDVAQVAALEDRYLAPAAKAVRKWATAANAAMHPIEMESVAIAVSVLLARPVDPAELFDAHRPPTASERPALLHARERLHRAFFCRATTLAHYDRISLRIAEA